MNVAMITAALATVVGCSMVVAGITILYPVAGLISAGALLAAAGLLVDFGKPKRSRK